jgi:hypothetical protein
MDKRDIYEHLANIYLDASSSKKKKNKKKHKFNRYILTGSVVVILLGFVSFVSLNKKDSVERASEVALILYPDTAKINFNFNPAKKEVYSINLNRLSLSRYKTLAFGVKKSNFNDKVSLRVEFTNTFNEKANLYLKDIPSKWKDYRVDFSQFKDISYWGEMSSLAFIVEEWNAKDKKDVIYIDNIRVLR